MNKFYRVYKKGVINYILYIIYNMQLFYFLLCDIYSFTYYIYKSSNNKTRMLKLWFNP